MMEIKTSEKKKGFFVVMNDRQQTKRSGNGVSKRDSEFEFGHHFLSARHVDNAER